MKPFLVYSALRLGLFLAVFSVLYGIAAVAGAGSWILIWLLLGAALISSVLSMKLLAGPREALARVVEARAKRAGERFEEMRSKEDVD